MDEPDLHMLIVNGGFRQPRMVLGRPASSHLPCSLLTQRTQATLRRFSDSRS